jgi:hypothetical protein
MEINVVDQLSRRGYRFFGRAAVHRSGEVFDGALKMVFDEEGAPYPVKGVVLLDVERAEPHIRDEGEFVRP